MAQTPFPADLWASSRTLADPQLSPDGSLVAYVASANGRADLVIRNVDGGPEKFLPCSPAIKRVSASSGGVFGWLSESEGFIYIGVDGGVHRLDLETFACAPLHVAPGALAALAVSPDGEMVAYVSDLQDVFVSSTDPEVDATVRLSAGNDFAVDPAWSIDSATVAWQEWDDPSMAWDQSRIALRDAKARDAVQVIETPDSQAQQPRFSPDGTKLVFLCDAGGFLVPWTADLDNLSKPEALVSGADAQFEYAGPTWGPGQRTYAFIDDGENIASYRNHGGWGRVVNIDTQSGQVVERQDATLDGVHSNSISDAFVAVTSGPTEPSRISFINDDEAITIAQATLDGLETAGIEPELVEWQSGEHTIHGRFYRAEGSEDKAGPLLVWIHGGPTGQSCATLFHRFSFFLQRGYSILVPDYRGSTGWGRDFTQALNGNWGVADVEDVAAGMQAAIDNGWGKADQLIPYGGSAGGFTALLLMQQHPELCAAGAIMYPVVNLAGFGESTWRFEAHYMDSLIGDEKTLADEFERRSPINHADAVKAPLFVLHGDEDVVVPVADSEAFVKSVTAAGATVEFKILEGEGHGWKTAGAVITELNSIDEFLRRHVLKESQ